METKYRFKLFISYLTEYGNIPNDERIVIESYLADYFPFTSQYLSFSLSFSPGDSILSLFPYYSKITILEMANTLFNTAGLRETRRSTERSEQIILSSRKTLLIDRTEYLFLDLLYSYFINNKYKEEFIGNGQSWNNIQVLEYIINTLDSIESYWKYSVKSSIAKKANNLKKAIKDFKLPAQKIINEHHTKYRSAMEKDNKPHLIIPHLFQVFHHYIPDIKHEPCCLYIAELLNIFYPYDFFTWPAIKKTLQRQGLI